VELNFITQRQAHRSALLGNSEQGSYTGIVDFRGRPNLEGAVVMTKGVFRGWSYEGEWQNGKITGRGTIKKYVRLVSL
jgi:hypothetical protein